VVLDDLSGGFEQNLPAGATFIRETSPIMHGRTGSSTNTAFESSIISRAYAAENLSHFIKRFNYNNNVIGSIQTSSTPP